MDQEFLISNKRVANWLGNPKRIILQLIVSATSYLTLPTAKFRDDAVYEYFVQLYRGKPETLIFDGKDGRYLEQINLVYNVNNFNLKNVLDLGCGDGSFFNWLLAQDIYLKSYTGVDFAHPNKKLNKNANIMQKDIVSLDLEEFGPSTIVAINILVYLNNNIAKRILNARKHNTELIIIDPIPGFFWDAYWGGVRLFYRYPTKIIKILKSEGWQIKGLSVDYFAKWRSNFFFPLSYCLIAEFRVPDEHNNS